MPPSLPKYAVPSAATKAACWSACVVFGQVFLVGSKLQQGLPKFQYGPIVVHVLPESLVS